MSVSKLTKYINLALNNSSEGEASTSARMFFKKLTSLDMKFNPSTFNLTRAQARRLADLAGKVFKGLNDTDALEAAAAAAAEAVNVAESYKVKKPRMRGVKEVCYRYFDCIDMNDAKARRAAIDAIVKNMGFDKRSVQSYASNYRAGKWR